MQSGIVRARYETQVRDLIALKLSNNQLLVAGKNGLVEVIFEVLICVVLIVRFGRLIIN